jgi:hypothetical protein
MPAASHPFGDARIKRVAQAVAGEIDGEHHHRAETPPEGKYT